MVRVELSEKVWPMSHNLLQFTVFKKIDPKYLTQLIFYSILIFTDCSLSTGYRILISCY